jgi:hypothetical protein
MPREADRFGTELGIVAYLKGVSSSGKAIRVSVIPVSGAPGIDTWIPISQVHDDSEIYGVDAQGARQEKGSHGRLILKRWWTSKPEIREELRGKGIPLRDYEGSSDVDE